MGNKLERMSTLEEKKIDRERKREGKEKAERGSCADTSNQSNLLSVAM